jgi:hypothetical protein
MASALVRKSEMAWLSTVEAGFALCDADAGRGFFLKSLILRADE